MKLKQKELSILIKSALAEDIGSGDITSIATIPTKQQISFSINAREKMVICGIDIAAAVFKTLDSKIKIHKKTKDGSIIKKGDTILTGKGNARAIFAAERVALNFLRQMSGVATLTRKYVDETNGTKAKILDTRKTIPGLRSIQKYAVKCGGGHNHRFGLYDQILIKDNHISAAGSIENAVNQARKYVGKSKKIEVECDTLDQVKEALNTSADVIMLDNMSLTQIERAVSIVNGKVPLEVSGNVTVDKVRKIAKTGIDFISAGSLTNNPESVDIGLDV